MRPFAVLLVACSSTSPEERLRPSCGAPVMRPGTLCETRSDCGSVGEVCFDGVCVEDGSGEPLLVGRFASGVVWPDGDVDRFAIDFPEAPAAVTFSTVSSADPQADLQFTWFDPDGVAWNTLLEPDHVDLLLPTPGRWTLEVRDAGDGGDEDFDYGFSVCEVEDPTGRTAARPTDHRPASASAAVGRRAGSGSSSARSQSSPAMPSRGSPPA